ncbi:MAG: winged helix-turn-helix transcriptional regulator [bacterium]|jgi:DNA-binding HxlR family transcriptional regulator
MTSQKEDNNTETCPVTALLKPFRVKGSNNQSLAVALKELEEANFLTKHTISEKPLHIECQLSDSGKALIHVFMQLENL